MTNQANQILADVAAKFAKSSVATLELVLSQAGRLDSRITRLAAAELASRQTVTDEELAAELAAMKAEG